MKTVLTGTHLIEIVLCRGRGRPPEIAVLKGGASRGMSRIVRLAEERNVRVRWTDVDEMRTLTGKPSAQIALSLGERETIRLDDVLGDAAGSTLILALEGVEDPHNVGEILRTAWAAGVDFTVLETRVRDVPRDALARNSAGASECLPIVFTDDVAQTLEVLNASSVETIAAVSDTEESIFDAKLSQRLAIVVGGERRGLSRHVLAACTRHVTIPTRKEVQSLSAASSCAVMLFEMVRRGRGPAGSPE